MPTEIRINRWGQIPATPLNSTPTRERSARNYAQVKITHASVGATDLMAINGDYLLHPRPGFTPGYDFVGILQTVPRQWREIFTPGQRVAGILPRMGAHATSLLVPPALLVPVPSALDSELAATIPLDGVTASLSLNLFAQDAGTLLIQGAGGTVGSWATQLARQQGWKVYGTGSAHTKEYGQSLGATMFDYHEATWQQALLAQASGGVDGAIDHTGSQTLRTVMAPNGRIVRIAFGGQPGHQRRAMVRGATSTLRHTFSHPSERICSVPIFVATHRESYRKLLAEVFHRVAAGSLKTPTPVLFPIANYRAAVAAVRDLPAGQKIVLSSDA